MAEQQQHGLDWMELFNIITTFILLNILWLFGVLFIVTIPAVTAALFAAVAPWTRGESPAKPVATFWAAIRRYWLKATAVCLIDLLIAGLVLFNLLILRQMGTEQVMAIMALAVTVVIAIILILANVYLWPLLVTLDQPLGDLLKNGLRLAIIHPVWGLLVAATAVIPLGLSLFLPSFFLLTVAFAAPAFIIQWGAWRVIRRYLNPNDIQNLGV